MIDLTQETDLQRLYIADKIRRWDEARSIDGDLQARELPRVTNITGRRKHSWGNSQVLTAVISREIIFTLTFSCTTHTH